MVDELAAMQVFYVNIGGGEPMLRPDFFELVDYAVDRSVGVKFSTNGTRHDAARARRLAAHGLRRRPGQHRRRDGRDQRRRPRRGILRRRARGHGPAGRGRVRTVQDQRRRHPAQRRRARRVGRDRRLLRRPAAADAPAAVGAGRRHLGRAAPDGAPAARALPLAARPSRHPDRRLVLPPLRARRAARRAQPVRRRPGGVPHRPGRRRLRVPLRHRRPVPGGQRAPSRAASPRCGATPTSSRRCVRPRARGPARRAGPTTRAAAGAWRPSSSPASRSTGPTPSASTGTARRPGGVAARSGRPTPTSGHSRASRTGVRCRCRPRSRLRRMPTRARAVPTLGLAPPGPRWTPPGDRAVLAVPVGSFEQHGPHLPLDTDTRSPRRWRPGGARPSPPRRRGPRPWPTAPAASTPASPARCRSGRRC